MAGNADYVVFGGEFPKVNGVAQQGLTRMARTGTRDEQAWPELHHESESSLPATTAVSFAAGAARVGFGTAWDYDNESLTYDVFRDNGATPVYTTAIKSNFWTLPTGGFTDTGLAPGSTHTYQVRISDPFGNTTWSPKSNVVTISSGTQSQYAQDVAADGAAHYWRLGEPSGATAFDWTGFEDATLSGGFTRGAAGAINGDTDAATTFDGSTGNAVDPERHRRARTPSPRRPGSRRPPPAAARSSASATSTPAPAAATTGTSTWTPPGRCTSASTRRRLTRSPRARRRTTTASGTTSSAPSAPPA